VRDRQATVVGATLMSGLGMIVWTLVASSEPARTPTIRIDTSEHFRAGQ
jgi:hypothetical protein